MASNPIIYKDLNADKFPVPVKPLDVHRDAVSPSTINLKDPHMGFMLGLLITHNVLRRSLHSVANHARAQTGPPSTEFLQYASFAMKFLHYHHEHEDTIFFPALRPYIDYSESSHEHEHIVLLITAVNDAMKVGGETLAKSVEALLEVLDEHLKKEEWLTDKYARRVPVEVLDGAEKKLQIAIKEESKECGTIWLITFFSRGMNAEENLLWPPMPWIMKFIILLIGGWKYKKQFAYAPY